MLLTGILFHVLVDIGYVIRIKATIDLFILLSRTILNMSSEVYLLHQIFYNRHLESGVFIIISLFKLIRCIMN